MLSGNHEDLDAKRFSVSVQNIGTHRVYLLHNDQLTNPVLILLSVSMLDRMPDHKEKVACRDYHLVNNPRENREDLAPTSASH